MFVEVNLSKFLITTPVFAIKIACINTNFSRECKQHKTVLEIHLTLHGDFYHESSENKHEFDR